MTSRILSATAHELYCLVARMLEGEDLVISPSPRLDVAIKEGDLPPGFSGAIVATSGSTGTPKRVLLSRRALLAATEASATRIGTGDWLNPLPEAYVAGLMTIVRAAAAGRHYTPVSPHLTDIPASSEPRYISIVPTQLHRALSNPVILKALVSMEAVLVGGARLHETIRREAADKGIRVVETYGMSETCGGVVYDGIPLPGVIPHIGGQSRISLTTGTAFSGYLSDQEATTEVLDDHTVRTNDRGAWDGHRLTVVGRLDDVVQSGGVNVDLAEMQCILDAAFPQKVACFAVADIIWGATVLVASTGPEPTDILSALKQSLESAALPRGYLRLDTLPRTDSGKIDRRKLVEIWEERHGDRARMG